MNDDMSTRIVDGSAAAAATAAAAAAVARNKIHIIKGNDDVVCGPSPRPLGLKSWCFSTAVSDRSDGHNGRL